MLSASGTDATTGGTAFGAIPLGAGLICTTGVGEAVGWLGDWFVLELEIQIAIPIAAAAHTVTILIGVKNPELFGVDSVAIVTNSNYGIDSAATRKVAIRVRSLPINAYSPGSSEVRGRSSMNTSSPDFASTRTVGFTISAESIAIPDMPAWVTAVARRALWRDSSHTMNGGCVP